MDITFIILALITLAGGIASITLRNLVHCALAVAGAFTGLAGLYLKLGAQFLGFAQFLVYVGAIAILILFVVLLTRRPLEPQRFSNGWHWGLLIAIGVCATICGAMLSTQLLPQPHPTPSHMTVRALGDMLMTRYVLALEVIGLLLTAALLGAVLLALPERGGTAEHKRGVTPEPGPTP